MRNKSLKAMSRGILLFLVVMIIAVPLLWIHISLPTTTYAVQNLEYDSSNVLEDLMSSEVIENGQSKPFNLSDYPKNALARSPKLINVVEYCYSARKAVRSHYGLYLYIYNPQLINFDDMSVQNKVQLAVTYDEEGKPEEYEKFDLQFCNRSVMAGTERLFYKYKVVDKKSADGKYIVDRVKGSERRYDISGFELLTKGESNAKDYTVGGTYKYSGYAKGCGADPEAESDLKCNVTDLETIELNVKNTFWRSDRASALGLNHQDELNSVYFSISNKILGEYGKLQKIKAEWYEYKTAPIIVTSHKESYDAFLPYVGLVSKYDGSIKYQWFSGRNHVASGSQSTTTYDWSYNVSQNTDNLADNYVRSNKITEQLPYVFYTNGALIEDYILSGETLTRYIENYNKSFVKGTVLSKTKAISADLFESEVDSGCIRGYNSHDFDADNKFDMLSFSSAHSGWDNFWTRFNSKIDGDYRDIAPIYEIKTSDLVGDFSKRLFVNSNDVGLIREYANEAFVKNETTFLFRFGKRDYYSFRIQNRNYLDSKIYDQSYYAQETVFLDFDIIQLTFNKDGVYTVIPVVSSPVDIVNDITPPLEKPDWSEWIKRILAIIVLIVVLIVLAPVLPYILKLVVWVITLPFRAIVWLVKSLKKKQ